MKIVKINLILIESSVVKLILSTESTFTGVQVDSVESIRITTRSQMFKEGLGISTYNGQAYRKEGAPESQNRIILNCSIWKFVVSASPSGKGFDFTYVCSFVSLLA